MLCASVRAHACVLACFAFVCVIHVYFTDSTINPSFTMTFFKQSYYLLGRGLKNLMRNPSAGLVVVSQ